MLSSTVGILPSLRREGVTNAFDFFALYLNCVQVCSPTSMVRIGTYCTTGRGPRPHRAGNFLANQIRPLRIHPGAGSETGRVSAQFWA